MYKQEGGTNYSLGHQNITFRSFNMKFSLWLSSNICFVLITSL